MFGKKCLWTLMFTIITATALWGQATLQAVWQTPARLKVPESVKYNADRNEIYVSNINGAPTEKNGQGFISKISPDGKIISLKWISGLNAPKGMALWQNKLYVSDIDRIVEIDADKGKIIQRYNAPGAAFFNDVAVDEAGHVYVSDMAAANSVIYQLFKGNVSVFLKGPEISSPNGLFYWKNTLYVGNSGDGKLKAVDLATRKIHTVIKAGHGIDGLIRRPDGSFIISDWSGRTELVTPEKKIVLLLDTRRQKVNSADVEYIPQKHLLLIPTFFDNRVTAYELKSE